MSEPLKKDGDSEALSFLDLNVEDLEKRLEMSAIPQTLGYLCFQDCSGYFPTVPPKQAPN